MKSIIQLRRELHMIPELSGKEFLTQDYIINELQNLNAKLYKILPTGLIYFFDHKKEETIVFRAEMDALPIKEKNDIYYKSKHDGIMHACGHDAHMAILIYLANYINQIDNSNYNFAILFQPSEEVDGGSKMVLETKILEKIKTSLIIGMHLWPGLNEGEIYLKENELMAKPIEININVVGKSAHVGNRNEGIDSLKIGIYMIEKIYNYANELKNTIVIFGKMNSGRIRNVISDFSIIEGTIRSFSKDEEIKLKKYINMLIKRIEINLNCKIKVDYKNDIEMLKNNTEVCNFFKNNTKVKLLKKRFFQGEDFANYGETFKTIFLLCGIGFNTTLHSENFDFNEMILNTYYLYYKKLVDIFKVTTLSLKTN